MPTTTNYGRTTPADTDLVKDGASAIRTLGTAIDTTVFNNAGAAIAKTIVDAKGDIIAATAADTVARLAVGANGTVLTADSAETTGLKWATPATGGMTLLSTTSLSGASTTISSINQTYKNLEVIIFGVTNASGAGRFLCDPNSSNSITTTALFVGDATYRGSDQSSILLSGDATGSRPSHTSSQNSWRLTIYNYADTTANKPFAISGGFLAASTANVSALGSGNIYTTSAIDALKFSNSGGNLSTGTVLIYGVK